MPPTPSTIIGERNGAETEVPDYGGANYPGILLETDIFPFPPFDQTSSLDWNIFQKLNPLRITRAELPMTPVLSSRKFSYFGNYDIRLYIAIFIFFED